MMMINYLSVFVVLLVLSLLLESKEELVVDNLILRMRIAQLELSNADRETHIIRICLNFIWGFIESLVGHFTPYRIVHLHQTLFKLIWKTISLNGKRKGRAPLKKEIRDLIRKFAKENMTWGAPRIHGELLKLGYDVSERTVSQYMPKRRYGGNPIKEWESLFHLQLKGVAGMDFLTVPTLFFRQLYCFFIIRHDDRFG